MLDPADIILRWQGPFSFTSRGERPLLTAPEGSFPGIYLWFVRADRGPLIHYVGETGSSFASRHVEHFEAYATSTYATRDSEALKDGRDVRISVGSYWKRLPASVKQPFIDNFDAFAQHILKTLELIDLYVAPMEGDQRLRRRVESGLINAIYAAESIDRALFAPGFRTLRRRKDEVPRTLLLEGILPIDGIPRALEV